MKVTSLIALVILTSCQSHQFIASPHYIPVNSQKGQLTLSATAINGAQAGYAITNSFSAFATIHYRLWKTPLLYKENSGNPIYKDSVIRFDAGIAYHKPINEKLSYGILTGFGKGEVSYAHEIDFENQYRYHFTGKLTSIYLQTSITYKPSTVFNMSVFVRNSYNRYTSLAQHLTLGSANYIDKNDQPLYNFLINHSTANLLYLEPGVQLQAGSKNLKFTAQGSTLIKENNNHFRQRQFNFFLGLSLTLDFEKKSRE